MAPASTTSSAAWIPLRDDYFETPLLSQKETAYLVRKACEAAAEVVERARSTGGPIQWRHLEKYNDVQLYSGFARGTYSAEATTMCGVTSVPGSLAEIASLFDLSTTRAMKDFSRQHRELCFDAVVLHTLRPRTREHPLHQVTAKWIATRSPKGLDDRDFCYLECQDKFTDSTGRKGWVMCIHSIKLPGCEDLSREFGFVRGSFYHSGIVVVEADRPGFVDIIHMLQINLKHNTKMPLSYLRERVAWVGKIKTILREKRLNEQRYLSDLELVPKKYRSRCNVCQDSFSLLLLRKMNCRKCGEVVCGACSKDFDVTNAKFLETVKLRICMHCYQLITAGQMLSTILDEPRASTALSLLGYYDDAHRASIITEPVPGGGGNGRGTTRERPTKIILHSMAQQRADRRVRANRAGGRPMGPPGGPMPSMDYNMPRPSNAYGYGYEQPRDARSLFDKPRGNGSISQAPPTPASLFDRQISRPKMDDLDNNGPPLQRGSTLESRGNIPDAMYDYGAIAAAPSNARDNSPGQRGRVDSNSSSSSTDSIDIDTYETGKAKAAKPGTGLHPDLTIDEDRSYPNAPTLPRNQPDENDEDTEGSVGSGDDEPNYKPRERPPRPYNAPTYYEDEEEEKKTEEFGESPALPPPSPSDYTSMHQTLLASARDEDLPFHRRNFNVSDLSMLDTAGCDINYLDTQMRQFHDQPFYMRDVASESEPRGTIDFQDVGMSTDGQREPSVASQGDALSIPQPPPVVTSPQKMMTSPQKSIDVAKRPQLYGRPKKTDVGAERESTSSLPSSLPSRDPSVTDETILLADALSRQAFGLENTLLSAAPSAHSNEDLTFKPEGNQADEFLTMRTLPDLSAQEKATEPQHPAGRASLPSYVPARFQTRLQPGKERLSKEEADEQKRLSDELLRSDDAKIERLIGRDALSHLENVRTSAPTSNQENIDDVDFEELLRMSKLEQEEKERKATLPGAMFRSQTLDSQLSDVSENNVSDDSESEDSDLLSARQMFSRFNSAKRLAHVAGVDSNENFQRRFEQIKEHIHMLSDSEDDSESGDDIPSWNDDDKSQQKVL